MDRKQRELPNKNQGGGGGGPGGDRSTQQQYKNKNQQQQKTGNLNQQQQQQQQKRKVPPATATASVGSSSNNNRNNNNHTMDRQQDDEPLQNQKTTANSPPASSVQQHIGDGDHATSTPSNNGKHDNNNGVGVATYASAAAAGVTGGDSLLNDLGLAHLDMPSVYNESSSKTTSSTSEFLSAREEEEEQESFSSTTANYSISSNSMFNAVNESNLRMTTSNNNNIEVINISSSSTEEEGSTFADAIDQDADADLVQNGAAGAGTENGSPAVTPPLPPYEEYTQGSLIVNLSTDSPSSSSIEVRQQQRHYFDSPLSSSRSAPPDLTHDEQLEVGEEGAEELEDLVHAVKRELIFSSTPQSSSSTQPSAFKSSASTTPQRQQQQGKEPSASAPSLKTVRFNIEQPPAAAAAAADSEIVDTDDDDDDADDEYDYESDGSEVHVLELINKHDHDSTIEVVDKDDEEIQIINQSMERRRTATADKQESRPGTGTSGGGGAQTNKTEVDCLNLSSTLEAEASNISFQSPSSKTATMTIISNNLETFGLPKTVTRLETPHGVQVYLIGTAHFSHESQNDVVQTIEKVRPKILVLELCHARQHILNYDEEAILKEARDLNFEKIRYTLKKSGVVQGALHLILLSMSSNLTKKLGMAPGGEFRVAYREAQKLGNCQTLFGDRVFSVTLARALDSLSLGQKIKLAWQFLTANDDITKEEIERCKEKDMLEQMLEEMTGQYPSISKVFVDERDIFLAHSLWLAAHSTTLGPVVGVVGMGHVPGMTKQWGHTNESMVTRVNEMPQPSLSSIIFRKSLKYGFYCLLGYGVYKVGVKVIARLPPIPESLSSIKFPTTPTGFFKKY